MEKKVIVLNKQAARGREGEKETMKSSNVRSTCTNRCARHLKYACAVSSIASSLSISGNHGRRCVCVCEKKSTLADRSAALCARNQLMRCSKRLLRFSRSHFVPSFIRRASNTLVSNGISKYRVYEKREREREPTGAAHTYTLTSVLIILSHSLLLCAATTATVLDFSFSRRSRSVVFEKYTCQATEA